MFKFLVMGLLRNSDARHGYALMKEYRERSAQEISTGNFYRELQRLVGEGLVRVGANPPGVDPRRAPYELTEAGESAFEAWFTGTAFVGSGQTEDEISSRTLFLAETEPATARAIVARWQEELWARGKALERTRELAMARAGSLASGRPFSALSVLLARRMKHVAADLEFVEELRLTYEEYAQTHLPEPHAVPAHGLRAVARPRLRGHAGR